MTSVPLARKRGLSPASFAQEHLQGAGSPVIVTDATEHWPARSKWTFDYLRSTYGSDFVTPGLGLSSGTVKLTRLGTYLDHLGQPDGELPGFWVSARDGRPLKTEPEAGTSPLYLVDWHAFRRHPELHEDISPAPYFVNDLVLALSPALREVFQRTFERDYWELLVGPAGSLSRLHQDFGHTHGYLAQIQGRKRVVLFSPEDTHRLYDGRVDPGNPDFDRYALLREATAHEGVLEPGDLLFIPADWWHWVLGLERSITVSHNFFNEANLSGHLTELLEGLPKPAA